MLSNYISKLLVDYDCVIIPDFGGFVANYASAKIHPTQHTFEPPYKQIAFNKNLTTNDGLLANAIALDQSISFQDATKLIEQEVLRIEIRLAKRENVELKSIGTLYYDIERNLQFNPSQEVNFLLDSFGLSNFQSPAIKRENINERIEKQFKDRPALPFPEKKNSMRKVFPLALTLSLLFIVIALSLKVNLYSKLKTEYSSLIHLTPAEKPHYEQRSEAFIFNLPAEKMEIAVSKEPAGSTITQLTLTADATKTIPVKTESAKADTSHVESQVHFAAKKISIRAFYLIAGCFKEKENADALVSELKAKGFDAELAGQNASGLYRVSYHTFTDRASAEAAKTELMSDNPGIWLLQN